MRFTWNRLRTGAQPWLGPAAFTVAAVVALCVGALQHQHRDYGIAEQRATGLAAVRPTRFYEAGLLGRLASSRESVNYAVVGDVPGGISKEKILNVAALSEDAAPTPSTVPDDSDRKMVRTDSLDLVVQHPADAAEQIRQIAFRLGGFLVTSEVSGDPDVPAASLTIRVPAASFEEARAEIRKLGLRVENERVEAQDVTRQYVDQQACLRNLQAEEAQYLQILKRASTVKDTLEVSEKLGAVRGQIEEQQAEFNALSKQVETVAITVSLRAEADTQVLGLHWRPLYRLKVAARDGLEGLGDYIGTMTAIAFYLPAILLWMATILIGAAIGWRILRWAGRIVFGTRKVVPSV